MIFKDPSMQTQYDARPEDLKQICEDFELLSRFFGIEPTVTRVTDNVDGSSGVHEAGRAVDFRDEYLGKRTYTEGQATMIAAMINLKYQRKDGKPTCLFHSFAKGPIHAHLQNASSHDKYVRPEVFKSKLV